MRNLGTAPGVERGSVRNRRDGGLESSSFIHVPDNCGLLPSRRWKRLGGISSRCDFDNISHRGQVLTAASWLLQDLV